jgi:hypothetical protein
MVLTSFTTPETNSIIGGKCNRWKYEMDIIGNATGGNMKLILWKFCNGI